MGIAQMLNRIFSLDNPKAVKATSYGYLNAIHYMAPASLSGVNLCSHASKECIKLCLGWQSGHAGMVKHDEDTNSVRKSRMDKAKRFMSDRQAYLADIIKSIENAQRKARKLGLELCVRLNGSTDIGWEGVRTSGCRTIVDLFPDVQFVDYTKNPKRALSHTHGPEHFPENYHLTFSRSETNEADCIRVLQAGGTVAVVFGGVKPTEYLGFPVIDGDLHDLRHLDPKGHVVALSPKGRKAKKDTSGFVVR